MNDIHEAVEAAMPDVIEFCRNLIRAKSLAGEEQDVAALVKTKLEELGYDRVWIDGAGNVLGFMAGQDLEATTTMLNSHLDTVEVGDPELWEHDPFGGDLDGDCIFGRGASDTKGAIAVQAFAPAILRRLGMRPKGDCTVAFVVFEELGGTGSRFLIEHTDVRSDVVISGEATSNNIRTGHRGALFVHALFQGKMAHGSVPELGVNPHYAVSRFLLELERSLDQLPETPALGPATISPTAYDTGSGSPNVIPGQVLLVLDCRTVTPDPEDVFQFVKGVAARAGVGFELSLPTFRNTTYTGFQERAIPIRARSFVTPTDHPCVRTTARIVQEELGRTPDIGIWRFCTDGYLFDGAGMPVFGFSPCEEHLAHTHDDHVKVSMMRDALRCYARMLLEL